MSLVARPLRQSPLASAGAVLLALPHLQNVMAALAEGQEAEMALDGGMDGEKAWRNGGSGALYLVPG